MTPIERKKLLQAVHDAHVRKTNPEVLMNDLKKLHDKQQKEKAIKLEEVEKNLKINKGDYNSMVSIAALFKKLYGKFPKIGMSGHQAECADSLLSELPDLK